MLLEDLCLENFGAPIILTRSFAVLAQCVLMRLQLFAHHAYRTPCPLAGHQSGGADGLVLAVVFELAGPVACCIARRRGYNALNPFALLVGRALITPSALHLHLSDHVRHLRRLFASSYEDHE
jgi:hypothetical protein